MLTCKITPCYSSRIASNFFEAVSKKKRRKKMKKEFTVKIFKKKAGAHYASFSRDFFGGFDKKSAFAAGRQELIRIAECDMHGDNDEEIRGEINYIKKGGDTYAYDQTTWSFKVFSKKLAKNKN